MELTVTNVPQGLCTRQRAGETTVPCVRLEKAGPEVGLTLFLYAQAPESVRTQGLKPGHLLTAQWRYPRASRSPSMPSLSRRGRGYPLGR